MAKRHAGCIVKFTQGKFGFIKPDDGGPDMFVLPQHCAGFGHTAPPVPCRVTYSIITDSRTGRPRAEDVMQEDTGQDHTGGKGQEAAPEDIAWAYPPAPVIQIELGVRGDSLLQTRHDVAKSKKYRTFKPEFEVELSTVFGNCIVDYDLSVEGHIGDVVRSIANGPSFEILCVGIGIQDLLDKDDWSKVVPSYPATLDKELEGLAAAIRSKANGSMVWVGGPAEFWFRPPRWDTYMAHARNTLRKAGLQVVPSETVEFVMKQMTLSNDGLHISNNDGQKAVFAKAWATCLYAAAADPTFGRAITDEMSQVNTDMAKEISQQLKTNRKERPDRSRSPPQLRRFSYGSGTESKLYGVSCSVKDDATKPWYERATATKPRSDRDQKRA